MLMPQKRITPERLGVLGDLDCRTLGFHPHDTMRITVPVDRILYASLLDILRW